MDSQITNWVSIAFDVAGLAFGAACTRMAEERWLSLVCRGRREVKAGLAGSAGGIGGEGPRPTVREGSGERGRSPFPRG